MHYEKHFRCWRLNVKGEKRDEAMNGRIWSPSSRVWRAPRDSYIYIPSSNFSPERRSRNIEAPDYTDTASARTREPPPDMSSSFYPLRFPSLFFFFLLLLVVLPSLGVSGRGFRCRNGHHVSMGHVCDDVDSCGDNSDENPYLCDHM